MDIIRKDAPQYKANLHCHSVLSDGKLTPYELKAAYKSNGYSVLAITDHEYPCDHSDMTDSEFLMLTGYEAYIRKFENGCGDVFTPEIHINLIAKQPHNLAYIGWNDQYCKYVKDPEIRLGFNKVGSQEPRRYDVEYINSFVRCAKDNGYICTHNHPFWSMEEWDMVEQYEGFFSMEIFNYSSYILNALEYNADLYDYLLRRGKRIFCHSADDNHNGKPFGDPGCDSFGGFTMIMAEKLDYPSVIEALEKGNFYSSSGPVIHSLKISEGKVFVECDGAKQITLHLGGRATKFVIGTRENPVCKAEFDIPERHKYIRIDILDFDGRHANTRAYFPDELA